MARRFPDRLTPKVRSYEEQRIVLRVESVLTRATSLRSSLREIAHLRRASVRRWAARLSSRRIGLVLLYHEIADASGDPLVEILPSRSAATLESHVRHLRRHYRLVRPSELAAAVQSRPRGRRIPVALTFDDDLPSHVSHAAPLLRRLHAPAAFFLCGSSLNRPWRFWWEDLQVALSSGTLTAKGLPGISEELVASALAGERRAAKTLAAAIEALPASRRAGVASVLRAIAGKPPAEAGLRAHQARLLAESGFELGFHTLRHDRLPPLDDEELTSALRDGRTELEAAIGRPLKSVSYPHGRADGRVADAARAAGFEYGFTGDSRVVRAEDDPLLLPRVDPTADSAGAFAAELGRLLADSH
jgi:peptidoglycan/xylan/chitin deacetylase (PgdA/CDA1 family)